MDEQITTLINQIKSQIRADESDDQQIALLLQEARAEAWAEARALIKNMFFQAILEKVVQTPQSPTARNQISAIQSASPDDAQLLQEMEAIKSQLAENERLLSQMQSAPAEKSIKTSNQSIEKSMPRADAAHDNGSNGNAAYLSLFCYVYGVVGDDAQSLVQELALQGVDQAFPVHTLKYKDVQAVLSYVLPQEFGQSELEANLQHMPWLEAKVLAHQQVLTSILERQTIIPMKFATIYQSEQRVRDMLETYYDEFIDALTYLQGKQELGVKIYCDRPSVMQSVATESDRVVQIKTEMDNTSEGAAYFLKKKLQTVIEDDIADSMDAAAQHIYEQLSPLAVESVMNPIQQSETLDAQVEMILNTAYLLDNDNVADFRRILDRLMEDYGTLELNYELTGPWPPYNFVTIGQTPEEGA